MVSKTLRISFHCKLSETWSTSVSQAHGEVKPNALQKSTEPQSSASNTSILRRVNVWPCSFNTHAWSHDKTPLGLGVFVPSHVWKYASKFRLTLNAALCALYKTLRGNHQIFIQHYPWSYSPYNENTADFLLLCAGVLLWSCYRFIAFPPPPLGNITLSKNPLQVLIRPRWQICD